MDIFASGALPASSVLWQPRAESWTLTVVCKATFALEVGQSPLAPDQEPIHERDCYWDDDPSRSLYAPSDLALLKPAADVVLVGYAFAQGGGPVRSLLARMVVGEVDKTVEVVCDRSFDQHGTLRDGPRFSRMPLGYDRAAGGPDTPNPVGVSREARDEYGATVVPNLQIPGTHLASPADYIEPTGFGPLAPGWPPRQNKLGPNALQWLANGAQGPIPDDLDRSYFQVAPRDQLTTELHANERIVLEHLHHEHARFLTSLPGVRPRAVLTGRARGPVEIPLRPDTLWIDTGRLICTLTWRGHLPLEKQNEPGRVLVTTEHPGAAASLDPSTRVKAKGKEVDLGAMTLRLDDVVAPPQPPAAALPFVAPSPATPGARPGPPPPPKLRPPPLPRLATPEGKPARAERSPDSTTRTFNAPVEGAGAPQHPVAATPFVAPAPDDGPVLAPPRFVAPPEASPWAAGAPAAADLPMRSPEPAMPALVPPPIVTAGAVGTVGQSIGMVLAASNASATTPEVVPAAAPPPAAAAPEARTSRDVLALVWFDKASLPRIVRKPAWQAILDDLANEPIDPEADDPALSDAPAEIEDRRNVFAILDRAAATDAQGVFDALAKSAAKRGQAAPPIELVDGDLTLPFDAVETLKALVSAVTPLATGDETLTGALATAKDFLGSPGASTAPETASGIAERIRDVYRSGKRHLPSASLDAQVERALLEERHYQKRKVLGGPHLRGLLMVGGSHKPLVVYLPVALAEELPLSARFRARIIVKAHLPMDEREEVPVALQAAALGRVVMLPMAGNSA